jgi:hypothetical protein
MESGSMDRRIAGIARTQLGQIWDLATKIMSASLSTAAGAAVVIMS